MVEALIWGGCLVLVLLCFGRISDYLDRTKTIYERVDQKRKMRIRVEKAP